MNRNVWSSKETAEDYLEGTRAAIPLAYEQIRVILKIIQHSMPKVDAILDVGCGDGILGTKILKNYPTASLTLTDLSDTMLNAAKEKNKASNLTSPVSYIAADMSDPNWINVVKNNAPYDVIVSGLAIHHLSHRRKYEIYGDIYDLLAPNGIFLNLERVESRTSLGEQLNSDNYIDSLYAYHSDKNPQIDREEVAEKYFYRPLKQSNILAPVEMQTQWLRELGYKNVDIFFKIFEIAIFGGTKRALNA